MRGKIDIQPRSGNSLCVQIPVGRFELVGYNSNMAKVGRPSSYSPDRAEVVLQRMYTGESIRSICRSPGMPEYETISTWRIRNPDFATQYAHARRAQVEARIEDATEMLLQTPMCSVPDPDGGVSERVDGAAVQLLRTRVDLAKWEASKLLRGPMMAPLDYGDKVQTEISGPDGGAIQAAITVEFVRPKSSE